MQRHNCLRAAIAAGAFLIPLLRWAAPCAAQTFRVDFSRWANLPPLVKTKLGVYQTPFLDKPGLLEAAAMAPDAGVENLRYEIAWGKPDTYAYDQIGGTAAHLTFDFGALDPFLAALEAEHIQPLLAMTYDPLPLKTGSSWQRWKDEPSNLPDWSQINRRYAAHYRRALGILGAQYEQWNEPDLPGDGGKVFFNGGPAQYAQVYGFGATGIREGDPQALVGGPAIAYDMRFVGPILADPIDFVSIHAYANAAGQIANMRRAVRNRPSLPIYLTEYASYTSFGPDKPNSRHDAAALFFRDVKQLLGYTDVTRVYWAQWVDNSLGLLTRDFHKKAIFNAMKAYQTMMPVDRNPVTPDSDGGVELLASSDRHTAAVAAANCSSEPRSVTVDLNALPFTRGELRLYRIDSRHASYVDNPASENLAIDGQSAVRGRDATWSGAVPPMSVVILVASDGSGQSLLAQRLFGRYVRSDCWFPNRQADTYADYDPRTSIFRLGLGTAAQGVAQIGAVIHKPPAAAHVVVRMQGPFKASAPDALFAVRLDYGIAGRHYGKSVLFAAPGAGAAHFSPEWGGRTASSVRPVAALRSGGAFEMPIARDAPSGWDGDIIITPILRDLGAGSCARIILEAR